MKANVVLQVPARFDLLNAQGWKDKIETSLKKLPEYGELRLDCSETVYVDSMGLGMLVIAYRKARANKNRVVLCNLNETLEKSFDFQCLGNLLELRKSAPQ